ncbi:bifunctional metallophosphatase/5'-nucleotidase [Porphyromonas circumdentaria]|nr:bifunctional UDP-sugar hydrolase/5'-nucleotidase [Porphyromonas circumdentaria]MBB6275909.1 2',3'-cyclic-nucleotide 2'-phosphodiesterase (5'-nucleotidase family) [Porphyromonas circumdentaria]MDO4722643.1 bifunctional UDP-sugar hydrolase/5'-nucleotidase [Porphyromonas circumdentaria]
MEHNRSYSKTASRRNRSLFACLLSLLVLFAGQSLTAQNKKVVLLSVNDMHAMIDQFPRFGYMVDSLRQIYPDMLLIGAGDNHSGNPINDLFTPRGYPMTHLMNEVKFDYSALGNHEFDTRSDLSYLTQVAHFPFLAANVFPAPQRGIRLLPSAIHTMPNGLKIGFIGLLQLEPSGLPATNPSWVEHVRFAPAQETIGAYRELRDVCDAVIVVSHLGLEEDRIIARDNSWVDLIIGGHSHTLLTEPVKEGKCIITQAGSRLRHCYLTTVTIPEKGDMQITTELLSIDRAAGKESSSIRAIVDEFNSNPFFKKVVGQAAEDFTSVDELGFFMADAHRSTLGVDITLQNRGGVRMSSLPKGGITNHNIYSLDPFGNEMVVIELTPEELSTLVINNWSKEFESPIYASGLYAVYHVDKKTKKCLSVELFTPNKKPLKKGHKYRVAYNNYIANAYHFEHAASYQQTGYTSVESILTYLNKVKTVPSYQKEKKRWKVILH